MFVYVLCGLFLCGAHVWLTVVVATLRILKALLAPEFTAELRT